MAKKPSTEADWFNFFMDAAQPAPAKKTQPVRPKKPVVAVAAPPTEEALPTPAPLPTAAPVEVAPAPLVRVLPKTTNFTGTSTTVSRPWSEAVRPRVERTPAAATAADVPRECERSDCHNPVLPGRRICDTCKTKSKAKRKSDNSRKAHGLSARAVTLPSRLSKEELRVGQQISYPVGGEAAEGEEGLLYFPEDVTFPKSRADCANMARPCPFVSCKHHLYLDVHPETGAIKLNFPDLEVWEMKESCSLDAADRGGITLEEVGEILNLTRERIRQVEVRGLLKLKMDGQVDGSKDFEVIAKAERAARKALPPDPFSSSDIIPTRRLLRAGPAIRLLPPPEPDPTPEPEPWGGKHEPLPPSEPPLPLAALRRDNYM